MGESRLTRRITVLWTATAGLLVAVVLLLTLRAAPEAARAAAATPWWCLSCGPAGGADLFQNLLLLIPLGFALRRAGWSFGAVALATLLLPAAIELTQQLLIVGRDAALGDVLTNWAGALIGYRLAGPATGSRGRSAAAPALLTALFLAQLIVTTLLLRPLLDGPRPWRIDLHPMTGAAPSYAGSVLNVERSGRPLHRASDLAAVADSGAASVDLSWTFTWDPGTTPQATPIMRIDDARGWALVALDHRSEMVAVEVRSRATSLRLRGATWGVVVPSGTRAGDTLQLNWHAAPGSVELALTGPAGRTARHIDLGAAHGWTLINPFTPLHASDRAWRGWTIAWLIGWGLWLGWVAAGVRRPLMWGAGALAGLILITFWSGAASDPLAALMLALSWLAAWRLRATLSARY